MPAAGDEVLELALLHGAEMARAARVAGPGLAIDELVDVADLGFEHVAVHRLRVAAAQGQAGADRAGGRSRRWRAAPAARGGSHDG